MSEAKIRERLFEKLNKFNLKKDTMGLLVVKDGKEQQQFDQQKQMIVGNRVKLLLKKEVSHSFHNSYEGGKSVAILRIVTSKKEVIKEIQRYLLDTFSLVPVDPFSGNHGTGMKCTLLINISELGQEMVKKINDEYLKVFPNTGSKRIIPVIEKKLKVAHKSVSGLVPEYLEQKQVVKERTPRSPADSCRISATALLASMFDFENKFLLADVNYKDLFSYDITKDHNCQVIRCINEEVAIKVELALCWLSGNRDVVVREDNDIMVNFTKMALTRQNPINITYTLPPDKSYRCNEIEARLRRVYLASKPTVQIPGIERPSIMDYEKRYDSFKVLYKKKDTVIKVHNLLVGMGWNTKLTDNGEILISTLPKGSNEFLDEKVEPAVSLTATLPVEKKETLFTELVEVKGDNVTDQREIKKDPVIKRREHVTPIGNNKMSVSTKVATPAVLSEEDALYEAKILELKALRSNTRVFLKLPPTMQEEVNDILFKEEHLLDEAISLLSFFKKK